MAPCVEILKVTASDAYKADPSVLDPVMQYVAEASGSIVIYSGLDIQEPQYLWLAVVWESLQHHQTLIDNKEVYPKLLEALGKASSKVEFLHHVTFSADIYDALAAPITEFASWDLHESTDSKEFTPLQAGLIDRIHEISPKILHKGGWGLTHETDKKVFVCLGWDSLDEFKAFVAGTPELGARLAQMKERASISLSFAKLTKYERK